jgi:hypothetical protein
VITLTANSVLGVSKDGKKGADHSRDGGGGVVACLVLPLPLLEVDLKLRRKVVEMLRGVQSKAMPRKGRVMKMGGRVRCRMRGRLRIQGKGEKRGSGITTTWTSPWMLLWRMSRGKSVWLRDEPQE